MGKNSWQDHVHRHFKKFYSDISKQEAMGDYHKLPKLDKTVLKISYHARNAIKTMFSKKAGKAPSSKKIAVRINKSFKAKVSNPKFSRKKFK